MTVPTLVVVRGAIPGQEYELLGDIITLGRDKDNTIAFPAAFTVSAHHARIRAHIGLFWIEDLNSTNGTFVELPGGERIRLKAGDPVLLVEGTHIHLADAVTLQARGVIASQDQATRRALARLQAFIGACHEQIARLPHQERQAIQARLQQLEGMIRQATSEADLARIVAEQLDTLTRTVVCTSPDDRLPPLPENLPDPDSPYRLPSLHNLFLSHLRRLSDEERKKKP